jgi:uncharacterized membrane protein
MLFILLGVVALLLALSARHGVARLNQELTSQAARLRSVEQLLGRRPDTTAPDASREVPLAPSSDPAAGPGEPAPSEAKFPEEPVSAPQAAAPSSAAAGPTLEERLGTRWAVWVGGLALALGGLLLVRYSIEQGVFGPRVRIALGGLFSLVLVSVGEWFRRSEHQTDLAAVPAAHVPSVLTAAGTISAFATAYAAHALYGFIGPTADFLLLGLIGIATMLAAALHGPALAGLGLAGSLAVPLLVSSQTPNPWPLVAYLTVVAGAAYALARLRRWLWLAVAVVAGGLLWGLVLVGQVGETTAPWSSALFVHVGLQLTLAGLFMALEPHLATADDAATPDWIATGALAALSVLAVVALAAARHDAHWMVFSVVTMAVLALTAWRSAPVAAAAVLAGSIALGAIIAWPGLSAAPEPRLLAAAVAEVLRLPDNVSQFFIFAAASTLAISFLSTLRLDRGRVLPVETAALYALAAIAVPLLALVLAYLRVTQFDRSISFALFAAVLAADFYLAAHRFDHRAPATTTSRLVAGAFAAGVAAAITLALITVLERGYLTVAFAVTALTTAYFAVGLRIPLLRYVVVALGFIVLGRLAWDPRIMGAAVGTVPVFNWLLLGYGGPAIAFLAAARLLGREREDLAMRLCDALGVLFAGLLVFFQIHHALNGGDPLANTSGHVEQGLFALMSLGFAYVLMRLDLGRANPIFRYASLAFAVLSAIFIIFGLGIVENPLLSSDRIAGVPIFSSLLLAYLVPGLAAVLLARASHGLRPPWYVTGAAVLAMGLLFGYVTLEVRHLFQGETIAVWKGASQPEIWSYSVSWLALGLVFLAYGIWRGTREPRLASAALVVLAVIKVFLYDLTGIGGLWRALSVMCLGAVLIGIGLIYQKLIFARPAGTAATPTPGA